MQSQDRGSAQVGVLVAEILGIPGISTIVDFAFVDGRVSVKRELEGGVKARVSCAPPALLTCQLGLNKPRYPTLPNIMKAKKKELLTLLASELLKVEAKQKTEKLFFPEKKVGGLILEGESGALVDQLINVLKEKTTALV